MKNNKQINQQIYITIVLFIVSILFTLAVKNFDVDIIGPLNSEVGFSTLNEWFHNMFEYNDFWYNLTKYLGILPFLLCGIYGLVGLLQITKRKSLLKVDKRIILLGVFYVAVLVVYVVFNKVVINYRPILEDGALEASYPSSHTLLAVSICLSSLLISKYYIKKDKLKIFDIATWILMVLLVVGRAISGVHWLTDIIGGIIIAVTLVSLYGCLVYEEEK